MHLRTEHILSAEHDFDMHWLHDTHQDLLFQRQDNF